MNEAIRQLPTDIRWYILRYLSISITADVSEDIRHFGKCKYRLQQPHYIFQSYYLLDYIIDNFIPFIRTQNYNRRMIVPPETIYTRWHVDTKDVVIMEYAFLMYNNDFGYDDRPYIYSTIKPTGLMHGGIVHGLQCWRAIYNIICMLRPCDREYVMNRLEHYYRTSLTNSNLTNSDDEEI